MNLRQFQKNQENILNGHLNEWQYLSEQASDEQFLGSIEI